MKRLGITGTAAMLTLLLLGAGVFEMGFARQDNQNAPKRESAKQTRPKRQNQHSAATTPRRQANRQQPARQQPARQARQQPQQQQQQRTRQARRGPAQQQPQRQARQQPQQQQRTRQARGQPAQQQSQQRQQRTRQARQQPQQQQQRTRQARGQPAQQQPQRQAQMQLTRQQRSTQQGEQRSAWQQHRARDQSEDRNWQQRGGYNGYRVPTSYYRSHYGRGHAFRVYDLPFMEIGGYPSFQYGGYWFSLVDPIPPYWGDNWYQNDNVYVVYADNGYYLYDSSYPQQPGIAISINF